MATIQGVYVALFGRPADPTGLAYFNAETNNGADLTAIGDLASTAEYQEKYKGQNNVEIVTAIYQQLFNRNPEAEGLNFFVNALNTGALSINNIAIAILDGAQGSDKTIVDAKIAAADLFTAAIDTPVEDASYRGDAAAADARAWLATITTAAQATQAAAEAALKDIVDTNFVGNTVTLAAGNSVVSNDAATLAFADKVTTSKNDTIGGTWDPANDKIDGGLGIDTFNGAVATAGVTVTADGLKNIEIINLTATALADTVDVANAKQATEVWNSASAVALEVTGLALTTTVGLTGANAATTFTFADTSGTADVANVALKAATGAAGLTINGVETINFTVSGASNIGALTANDVKAITVAGAATDIFQVNLATATKLATYTGFDGADYVATSTGALTVNQTIATGAGADLITVTAAASTFTLTLTGGAGADKFVFGAAANITDAAEANFAKSLITITDFNKSEDIIDVSAGGNRDVLDAFELQTIANAASLHAALNLAAGFTTNGEQSVFVYGGDAYVFSSTGATFSNTDGLIKVTGVTDVADFTATNFVI